MDAEAGATSSAGILELSFRITSTDSDLHQSVLQSVASGGVWPTRTGWWRERRGLSITMNIHAAFLELPSFTIEGILAGETALEIKGRFSQRRGVRAGRGFLYRPNGGSLEVEVVREDPALLSIDNSDRGAVMIGDSFPYFFGFWEPQFLEDLADPSIDWVRVEFTASDRLLVKYSSARGEANGSEEAGGELLPGSVVIDRIEGGWDRERCQICGERIGPHFQRFGYRREQDVAAGRNSKGIWICESDYNRYIAQHSLAFVLGRE